MKKLENVSKLILPLGVLPAFSISILISRKYSGTMAQLFSIFQPFHILHIYLINRNVNSRF